MRTLYTLLVIVFASGSMLSQACEIPNGDFETWTDLTIEFDSTGVLAPETVIVPEGYYPLFRLFLASFSQVLGAITDVDLAENYLGISRSTNASEGEYAMLVSGNNIFSLSDAFSIFSCDGSLPEEIVLDMAHASTRIDTVDVVVTLSDNSESALTEDDLLATAGYGQQQYILQGDLAYTEVRIPIDDNLNGVAADTVFLWIIVNSDAEQVADGVEAGVLIDNIRFENPVGINTPELSEAVKVYPMPFKERIFLDNENEELRATLYNSSGMMIKKFQVDSGTKAYDMSDIQSSGNFILELEAVGKNERSTYNIIKG